jgi:hypothetical protein
MHLLVLLQEDLSMRRYLWLIVSLITILLTGCGGQPTEVMSVDTTSNSEGSPARYEIPVVLLFNGEPVEDVDSELLRATFDGEVVTIRWHPGQTRRGYDGSSSDVLEFGLPTLYDILGDDYSEYTADFIGTVYAWQGSDGNNLLRSAVARFERQEDLIIVKLVFENPVDGDGIPAEGKKPLSPHMAWFTPPWRISYGDQFVITIRIH